MLHRKRTPLIHIYPSGINTDPITHLIDTCWRQTSTPVISHILHYILSTALSHSHIHLMNQEKHKQKYRNILSVIFRDIYYFYNKTYNARPTHTILANRRESLSHLTSPTVWEGKHLQGRWTGGGRDLPSVWPSA